MKVADDIFFNYCIYTVYSVYYSFFRLVYNLDIFGKKFGKRRVWGINDFRLPRVSDFPDFPDFPDFAYRLSGQRLSTFAQVD